MNVCHFGVLRTLSSAVIEMTKKRRNLPSFGQLSYYPYKKIDGN